ncbi:MAG: ABC transporter ATP-binding protein [Ruminiclostridium sp.]|nr:ABC transporter ATP-binding protein [Ruminiclostridium sp.]
MINFENVSKYCLSDITLNIPKGEIVGIIGASGTGKTTLIKLACGLLAPDSGNIWTLGKDPVKYRRKYASDISAFIAGTPLLNPEDTVMQGFEMIAEIYGLSSEYFGRRYSVLSEKLGFAELPGYRVKDLSLGQKMRAELGAALLYEPKLLLLDEPNVGLDENGKSELSEVLKQSSGMTVFLTSHDMSGISKLCTRLAILDGGKLVFYGSLDNLRSRYLPINRVTVHFSGRVPDLDDLPLQKYSLEGNTLKLEYNSNHITAAQITALLLKQTEITGIGVHKPDLEELVIQIRGLK